MWTMVERGPHLAYRKECVLETLHLKLRAPQFHPDRQEYRSGGKRT